MTDVIEFFYEFASTYSYLSVTRLEEMAAERGLEISWRPFLLGPIFKHQGWDSSPFNVYPAKGRYMVRDIERIAAARGITFVMPDVFPANGLKAARLATVGLTQGFTTKFTVAVFKQQFGFGRDIADDNILRGCLAEAGADPDAAFRAAASQHVKDELRASTEQAVARGIFGAPSFVTQDGELFWGDDRLEHALAWAQRNRGTS